MSGVVGREIIQSTGCPCCGGREPVGHDSPTVRSGRKVRRHPIIKTHSSSVRRLRRFSHKKIKALVQVRRSAFHWLFQLWNPKCDRGELQPPVDLKETRSAMLVRDEDTFV